MKQVDRNRIDRITETVHYLLKGEIQDIIETDESPDDEIKQLSGKVNELIIRFREIQNGIIPLSQGNLNVNFSKGNILASPFKQMQASLKHLTWQTQEIARGDFNQRVDFMGDFSIAFNSMVDSLKESRSQLLAEMKQFEELAEIKTRYLNIMAHDIRTPLGSMIGLTNLLLEQNLDEAHQNYLQIIKRSGASLLALINNILDFAKLEKKKMELTSNPFSLQELLEDIKIIIQPQLKEGVNFKIEIKSDIINTLAGDPHRLQQVFINLIGNAAKFTENGQIKLSVRLMSQTDDSVCIKFEVKDTGIGIAKEKLKTIFSPFTQAESGTASRYGGTGLGLSIAGDLISLMGGKLEVDSDLGKGTTFYFTITLQKAADEVAGEPAGQPRVLVVEDDPSSLAKLIPVMQRNGVRFELYQDGNKVIKKMNSAQDDQDPFSMVWLNLQTKGVNEFKLVKDIKNEKRFSKTKIVISTSKTEYLLQSENDQNYNFLVTRPIKKSVFDKIVNEIHEERYDSVHYDILDGKRIIVTDDNSINRLIVKKLLKDFNTEIFEAENGRECLNLLQKNSFDLILMDMNMPVMNGQEAICQLRKDYPEEHIPVIAFTADESIECQNDLFKAGADEIVFKPINKELLTKKIAIVLKRSKDNV